MHMEHAKPVLDACHLHEGQHVLMASGRAARVADVGQHSIRFEYLEQLGLDDCIVLPRHRVLEMVRV